MIFDRLIEMREDKGIFNDPASQDYSDVALTPVMGKETEEQKLLVTQY